MVKKMSFIITIMLALIFTSAASAFAFRDIAGDPAEAKINALRDAGLIGGISEEEFAPQGVVTYATGIHLIVKGMNLNIDPIRFIKEPKAADYFTGVPNDAWYASSFIVAQLNGLDLPKDIDPNQTMSREEFAHYLAQALHKTGDYAFIEIYLSVADEGQVMSGYMGDIQTLLITHIAQLDEDGRFNPKAAITRSQAAQMLHDAILFVKNHKPIKEPSNQEQITINTVKVTDDVNKVILSRGEKPSPGYGISIESIRFTEDKHAVIAYKLHEPKPDMMYPAVITEVKAETYVAAGLEIQLEQVQ